VNRLTSYRAFLQIDTRKGKTLPFNDGMIMLMVMFAVFVVSLRFQVYAVHGGSYCLEQCTSQGLINSYCCQQGAETCHRANADFNAILLCCYYVADLNLWLLKWRC
jgi:hypothetical protein